MNRPLFAFFSALTLSTFLIERYASWYAPGCPVTRVVSLDTLRILFFGFFAIQVSLPFYHWAKDPNFTTDTASGIVLFASIVSAVLGFFIYNVPLAALNTIVKLAQLCMNS
jgi:hypothetical protein